MPCFNAQYVPYQPLKQTYFGDLRCRACSIISGHLHLCCKYVCHLLQGTCRKLVWLKLLCSQCKKQTRLRERSTFSYVLQFYRNSSFLSQKGAGRAATRALLRAQPSIGTAKRRTRCPFSSSSPLLAYEQYNQAGNIDSTQDRQGVEILRQFSYCGLSQ